MKAPNLQDLIIKFTDKNNIFAVVGVSRDEHKYGHKIYRDLKNAGYKVYPINPKENEILGDKCYKDLYQLPEKPDVIDIVTPPNITKKIVRDCKKIGTDKVWLQPGSESDEIIEYCKQNKIRCIHSVCIMVEKQNVRLLSKNK